MFKVGDKIKCIDDRYLGGVTKGNIYIVINIKPTATADNYYVTYMTDKDGIGSGRVERFILVKDEHFNEDLFIL